MTNARSAKFPRPALAQQTHTIDLSPDLYGKIYREVPGEVFSPGIITIHRKRDKELIRVDSEARKRGVLRRQV
jgi:hypothetical protein